MSTMIKVYPIVLIPTDVGYVVAAPDLDINTQGKDLAEAIYMSRDTIGLWNICPFRSHLAFCGFLKSRRTLHLKTVYDCFTTTQVLSGYAPNHIFIVNVR